MYNFIPLPLHSILKSSAIVTCILTNWKYFIQLTMTFFLIQLLAKCLAAETLCDNVYQISMGRQDLGRGLIVWVQSVFS